MFGTNIFIDFSQQNVREIKGQGSKVRNDSAFYLLDKNI